MRVKPIELDKLDPARAELCQAIAGPRGGIVDGPFRVWLQANPKLAKRMNEVGRVLRDEGTLDKRLLETAVLCVARFWDAPYQWAAHAPIARNLGLSKEAIDEIGCGCCPRSAPADEQAVYDLTASLLGKRRISDELYESVHELIGFDDMVELITAIGQYSMAAIVTNGFDIEGLSGGPALPERVQDGRAKIENTREDYGDAA